MNEDNYKKSLEECEKILKDMGDYITELEEAQHIGSDQWKDVFKTNHIEPKGNDELMATCWHEAGHAIIDLLRGFNPGTVTIVPDKGNAGSHQSKWQIEGEYDFSDWLLDQGVHYTQEEELEYYASSLLAGIIAEAMYSGKYDWGGAIQDLNTILDVHLGYGITSLPDEYLQSHWDKTLNLLEGNVSTLLSIARDMYNQKTLHSEYFEKHLQ